MSKQHGLQSVLSGEKACLLKLNQQKSLLQTVVMEEPRCFEATIYEVPVRILVFIEQVISAFRL